MDHRRGAGRECAATRGTVDTYVGTPSRDACRRIRFDGTVREDGRQPDVNVRGHRARRLHGDFVLARVARG